MAETENQQSVVSQFINFAGINCRGDSAPQELKGIVAEKRGFPVWECDTTLY